MKVIEISIMNGFKVCALREKLLKQLMLIDRNPDKPVSYKTGD